MLFPPISTVLQAVLQSPEKECCFHQYLQYSKLCYRALKRNATSTNIYSTLRYFTESRKGMLLPPISTVPQGTLQSTEKECYFHQYLQYSKVLYRALKRNATSTSNYSTSRCFTEHWKGMLHPPILCRPAPLNDNHALFEWILKLAFHPLTIWFVTQNILKDNVTGIDKMMGYFITENTILYVKSTSYYLIIVSTLCFCEIVHCSNRPLCL